MRAGTIPNPNNSGAGAAGCRQSFRTLGAEAWGAAAAFARRGMARQKLSLTAQKS